MQRAQQRRRAAAAQRVLIQSQRGERGVEHRRELPRARAVCAGFRLKSRRDGSTPLVADARIISQTQTE